MSARIGWHLRWRLSVMWALEWGITGALVTYLPLYFQENGLSFEQISRLMAVSAVGLWVAPFVVGQVCDRWMASEKYLAISHFVGGLTLWAIPIATEIYRTTDAHFAVLTCLVGLYAVAYFPTVPLASSLSFRHLPDPDAQFAKVRIWGTVGWVLSGFLLSVWLGRVAAYEWVVAHFPQLTETVAGVQASLDWVGPPSSSDCFRIAALLSFALASFCVFLPSTPPEHSRPGTIAPLQTLSMFRDPTFSKLIAISFVLAVVVPFYTVGVPKLLAELGYTTDWIPAVMTIGQISEFPALLLLPFCLKRLGLKITLGIGMAAWLVRFLLFAVSKPAWLIPTGIALHGVCHVFLIIVIQLYVDRQCRRDLRTSAQNLFAFITMGIAMPIGFLISGKFGQLCFDKATGSTNYHAFYLAPAALVLVLLAVYVKWFRQPMPNETANLSQNEGPSSAE